MYFKRHENISLEAQCSEQDLKLRRVLYFHLLLRLLLVYTESSNLPGSCVEVNESYHHQHYHYHNHYACVERTEGRVRGGDEGRGAKASSSSPHHHHQNESRA